MDCDPRVFGSEERMSRTKSWISISAIAVVCVIAVSCAPQTPQPKDPHGWVTVVNADPHDRIVTVTVTPANTPPKRPNWLRQSWPGPDDIATLDPQLAFDDSSVTVVKNTFIGLTALDEQSSEPQPGLATHWDISEDRRTYTFHLRDDVPWVRYDFAEKHVVKVQDCAGQDRMVTAYDFEYGILRALDPKTEAGYADVLVSAIEGADAFNLGTITDTAQVGVKALDDWTLQVTFKEDAAYNTNIIGHWTAYAVPKWVIEGDECNEAYDSRWIEAGFFQSYGPFTLQEWIHDANLTIIKNPFWRGDEWTPQAKIDQVTFFML